MLVIFWKKKFCREVGFTRWPIWSKGNLVLKAITIFTIAYTMSIVTRACGGSAFSLVFSFQSPSLIFLLPLGFHRAPLLECTLSIISIITCLLLSMGLIASGCFILVTYFTFSWLSSHQELIWVWINNRGKKRPSFFLTSFCTNPTLLVMCLAIWMTHSMWP
jgi:hypothetical protein